MEKVGLKMVCVCVCVCLWGRRGGGGNSICFVVLLKRKIH